MAHPERHPGHNPEKFESYDHPIILRAREAQAAIDHAYQKGGIAQAELEQHFAEHANLLTKEAKENGLFRRPVTLSGDSLRLPLIIARGEPSFGSVPAPHFKDEMGLGHPPTFQGPFLGFRYIAGPGASEYYLTAQVLAYETRTADGDFTFYASCQVDDASLEFPHEARAAEIERSLRVINSQIPIEADTSFRRLHTFTRENFRSGKVLERLLPHFARLADELGKYQTVRNDHPLRHAITDLLTNELSLPRPLDFHREPYNLNALPYTTGDWSVDEFKNVNPQLIYKDDRNTNMARLCFAVIHRGEIFHVPLRWVTSVKEHS